MSGLPLVGYPDDSPSVGYLADSSSGVATDIALDSALGANMLEVPHYSVKHSQ